MSTLERVTKKQDVDIIQVRISGDMRLAGLVKERMLKSFQDWIVDAGNFYRKTELVKVCMT